MTEAQERLSQIRKSISDMSDDELYEAIGQSRNNRRAPSEQVTRKTRTSKKAKTPKQPKDLFSSLSPEAAAELLKKLNLNG